MHRLLVVSDLYLEPAGMQASARAHFPQLPALSRLLHLGRMRAPHQDWRAGLAADLDVPALAEFAPAQIAACALRPAPESAVCMADPVHLVAGLASVHLHPAGLLQLEPESRAELQSQFLREFGAQEQSLLEVGDGLLLAAPDAAAANAADPARLLGSLIEVGRSVDPAQRALRRLGVEIEMWLPGLALNRRRERRGDLPVTALWFWGGGRGALPPATTKGTPVWEQAYGSDPWLHGLWSGIMKRSVLAARCWDELTDDRALVVVSAARVAAVAAPQGPLQKLEQDWFAPALRDLRSGRVTALVLRIGGQRWDLRSRPRSRWWRRAHPWWRMLTP